MSAIPTYSQSCLVQSSPKPSMATTFYLIGVPSEPIQTDKGRLEINLVDLKNIAAPISTRLQVDEDRLWSSSAPKLCSNFAGTNNAAGPAPLRIHIQQFLKSWTFDANASPNGNNLGGGVVVDKSKNLAGSDTFVSPKQFAVVGQTSDYQFFVARTDVPMSATLWTGYVVDSTANVTSKSLRSTPTNPSNDTLLVVGTFSAVAPPVTGGILATGNVVAFEANGTSGRMYPTLGMDDMSVAIKEHVDINMNNFKLTSAAIPVHFGATAYILDKAKDGSVIIYTFAPPNLTLVKVSPNSQVPTFGDFMVGSAMAKNGSSTASQIVVYSVQGNSARFNSFDIDTQYWLGVGLVDRSSLTPDSDGGNNGGNGADSGNSSSGKSNAAIIGGAVAGVLVLVLIAAFFIVRRKRQHRGRGRSSQKHSSLAGGSAGGGSGGSSDLGAEEREENKPVLSDYQQQQNRASLNMVDSSRGSIITLNSSSTAPLAYAPLRSSTRPLFSGQAQPEQPTSAPLTVPQQLQLQQQQIQQQQQLQQQQARRGATTQGTEGLSLPAILEQHPFELHGSEADEEQLRKLEQESPYVARPYSNVPSFSYPSVYQDGPRHSHQPVRTTVINPYSGASVVDDEEQEPYVLPDPIIVAPTPMPHKAELLD